MGTGGRWGVLVVLAGLWQAAGHLLVAPTAAATLAATVLAATMLAAVVVTALALRGLLPRGTGPAPLTSRAAALRRKSWSAAFIRQRDPDAPGRSRPRAPTAAPAAA